jgi:hypothetical protein
MRKALYYCGTGPWDGEYQTPCCQQRLALHLDLACQLLCKDDCDLLECVLRALETYQESTPVQRDECSLKATVVSLYFRFFKLAL